MRYGVFSDVHSNLEAFQVVLNYYQKQQIDRYIFLGDIVGYGSNPQETIALLKRLNAICIAGNHDLAAVDKFDVNSFNSFAREALLWTKKQLDYESKIFLSKFSLTYEEDDFICVHGSLDDPYRFNYVKDMEDALNNFSLLKKRICFIGHSHSAEAYCLRKGEIFHAKKEIITLAADAKYIVNVGSVGQPRDHDLRASACVFDTDKNTILFKRFEYDIKKAAGKIIAQGLPEILGERLYAGW